MQTDDPYNQFNEHVIILDLCENYFHASVDIPRMGPSIIKHKITKNNNKGMKYPQK